MNQLTHVKENGDLYYKEDQKVALVYYRAGIAPKDYNEDFICGKKKVELSKAVPIPWVGAELVGQKRMQSELSKKEVMLRYISEEEANVLLETVIETWDFGPKDF